MLPLTDKNVQVLPDVNLLFTLHLHESFGPPTFRVIVKPELFPIFFKTAVVK